MSERPFVSVVLPIYNEKRYIKSCVDSLFSQDYPRERMEWIFVDGVSTDGTLPFLEEIHNANPALVRILSNPKRTAPYAMNAGISASSGSYIIRMDAHSSYASDYISQCVSVLLETGADNVGGVAETRGRTFTGKAIAKVLSSKFGVGNSGFRTHAKDGYTDTVPFGAFKREAFEKWGGYDERLTRNQDNEMNYRIRSNGGKIYLSNKVHFTYYCRETILELIKMGFQNGKWNVITVKLCPGSMGMRHFVPLAFVVSLIVLPILSIYFYLIGWIFKIEIAAYAALDLYYSLSLASGIGEWLLLLLLFPIFHCAYGIGSLSGLCRIAFKSYQ